MQYLGIDCGTRRAAWCAIDQDGSLQEDHRGRVGRPVAIGPDARRRREGARVHRDDERRSRGPRPTRPRSAGRSGSRTRKANAIAPLACKTDRVDARAPADLLRRDLVPEVWVPSVEERANRERLRRRSRLIRLPTSAINRTFGLLTQWGLRRNLTALGKHRAIDELADVGVPAIWRQSIVTLLDVIYDLDRQLAPLEQELRPHARQDSRVQLLMTIAGVAELLGFTIASQIGEISRLPSVRQLVGYSGLTPTIQQSGQSSRTGRILQSRPRHLALGRGRGPRSRRGGQPTRGTGSKPTPKHRHGKANPGQGRGRPQGAHRRLARPRPPATIQKLAPPHDAARTLPGKLPHSSGPQRPTNDLRSRDSCNTTTCATRGPKDISAPPTARASSQPAETTMMPRSP
jgi:transposase